MFKGMLKETLLKVDVASVHQVVIFCHFSMIPCDSELRKKRV